MLLLNTEKLLYNDYNDNTKENINFVVSALLLIL